MDIFKDHNNQTLPLKPDYEGEMTATLVTSNLTWVTKGVYYICMVMLTVFLGTCGMKI
jgi:hypothetical protein